MAMNDAVKMINTLITSDELRSSLYVCNNPQDVDNALKTQGYSFTREEFNDAYRSLLLKCQFEDQVEQLNNVVNMYRMLSRNFDS